jgi:hypothetical protein
MKYLINFELFEKKKKNSKKKKKKRKNYLYSDIENHFDLDKVRGKVPSNGGNQMNPLDPNFPYHI